MTDTSRSAQAARQELYDCIRSELPFEEKAREALELGVEYLGADNGHLTRIDQAIDHWEAIVSTDSADGQFPPGLELDLETTYCRRTIEADGPITLHDTSTQGWADDPAFEAHGLHCYHGTTLVCDGDVYGTVCFVAEDPQREQFSDSETMFVELLARLLERELERESHESQLTRQANLAIVLNRVLRHNLRNDLSVVRGYINLMADTLDAATYSEPALDNIDKLLQLSQKARTLNQVIVTEFDREPTDIVTVVEEVVEGLSDEYPTTSFIIDVEDDATVTTAAVFESFERSVKELIENAAKHSGTAPTVTVTIDTLPNAVEIRITDDGPGLGDHEIEVLETETETPLTHGSGLGLWLAHWIVSSHGGSIDATTTDDGTTMTISMPRESDTTVHQQLTELERARDHYQAVFEEAYDAMVIIDDDARILDANPEASHIYGADRQELLGRAIPEFLPDDFDFEAAWQEFQNAGTEQDTVTIIGFDGVKRQVEYSATTQIVPGQHLIIARDLTKRVKDEQAIQ